MEIVPLPWKNWPYKNTTLLVLSLLVFFYILEWPYVQNFITSIGELGYIGSFLSGALFVSVFTVAPASIVIFDIAKSLDPISVAVTAGAGAVLGDYIIFRYLKDKVFDELAPVAREVGAPVYKLIFRTPYFSWLIPLVGAFIVASPLPDELGISLLGLSKVKSWQFLLITFLLNSVGILVVVLAGSR